MRGMAVLLVVLFHAILYNPASTDRTIDSIAILGQAGVDLFFVLSGFLITGILLNAKGRPGYFRNFYAKRALRIWPLYYLLLFITFAIVPFLAHYAQVAVGEAANIESRNKLVYILLLQNLWYALPYSPTLLAMTWSLAIEEQFYIVWPGLVRLCSRKGLAYILGLIILITPGLRLWAEMHGVGHEAIYRITLFRLDGLSLGALISLWYLSDFFSEQVAERLALGAIAVGMGGWLVAPTWLGDSLVPLACAGVVLLAIWCFRAGAAAGRVFRGGWLQYIGRVSYCLYLVHQPVYYALNGLGKKYFPGSNAVNVFMMVLGFAVALGVASLSWYLFESQILKWKERVLESRAPKAIAPA